jgi:AbiV family abortive infection protein
MPITESLLRQAALTCFANAQDIHKEAYLLFEHGYYARAAALAVIGSEEFAKSIIYTIGAFRPDQREQLSKALRRSRPRGELFLHEAKHLIDAQVEGTQIETSEGMNCLESEIGFSIGYGERFQALLDSLIACGLDYLIPSREEAKHYAKHSDEIYYGAAPSTLKEMASTWMWILTATEELAPPIVWERARPDGP